MCLPTQPDLLPIPLLLKSYSSNTWYNTPLKSPIPYPNSAQHEWQNLSPSSVWIASRNIKLHEEHQSDSSRAYSPLTFKSYPGMPSAIDKELTDRRAGPAIVLVLLLELVLYELRIISGTYHTYHASRQHRYYICSYVCSMYMAVSTIITWLVYRARILHTLYIKILSSWANLRLSLAYYYYSWHYGSLLLSSNIKGVCQPF